MPPEAERMFNGKLIAALTALAEAAGRAPLNTREEQADVVLIAAAVAGLAMLARSGRLKALGFDEQELLARLEARFPKSDASDQIQFEMFGDCPHANRHEGDARDEFQRHESEPAFGRRAQRDGDGGRNDQRKRRRGEHAPRRGLALAGEHEGGDLRLVAELGQENAAEDNQEFLA